MSQRVSGIGWATFVAPFLLGFLFHTCSAQGSSSVFDDTASSSYGAQPSFSIDATPTQSAEDSVSLLGLATSSGTGMEISLTSSSSFVAATQTSYAMSSSEAGMEYSSPSSSISQFQLTQELTAIASSVDVTSTPSIADLSTQTSFAAVASSVLQAESSIASSVDVTSTPSIANLSTQASFAAVASSVLQAESSIASSVYIRPTPSIALSSTETSSAAVATSASQTESSMAAHGQSLTIQPQFSSHSSSPASSSVLRSIIASSAQASKIPVTSSAIAPTMVPVTPDLKKFTFSFRITNQVCTVDIRENNIKSAGYQMLAQTVLRAISAAFRNDPYFRAARILYFDCGSVIPVVEIFKNESVAANAADELKPASDLVRSGSIDHLVLDANSFSSQPSKSSPNIYMKLNTKLSNLQFCSHTTSFKDRFASFLVATDGLSFVSPSQIVIFESKCNDKSAEYNVAEPYFYVTASTNDAATPDKELTVRAYKLIEQFISDGTTWRLSASLDGKVKSIELAGKDKEETTFSDLTIVLIGMGVTFALLFTIIIIILLLICLRKKKSQDGLGPLTISNRIYEKEEKYPFASADDGHHKTAIDIDGHDYEYPLAPEQGKVKPEQGAYLELQPLAEEQKNNVQPVPEVYQELQPAGQEQHGTQSLYQPLSAEEEKKYKVVVEPEENISSVRAFTPEVKELSTTELALRKNNDDHMKREFESLEYNMPAANVFAASLKAKNRLHSVIPRPETRVVLTAQGDDPDSDYINANYVRDSHLDKKYIVTQGPLQKTVNDFWRMIIEQNVHVIVMVTPLALDGSEKCIQYWPPDSAPRQYGAVEIHLSKKELKPDFTITTMKLKSHKDEREVVLFRYMTWPEQDIPENEKSFLSFLLEARKVNEAKGNHTLVVHCSNGVGVSAVFAAVSNGIDTLNERKAVDVYSIVKELRKDRAGSVQNVDQYKFIYQALYEYTLQIQEAENPYVNQADVTSAF